MGWIISLAVVAAIVVLIVMSKKHKKAKALESLKNSDAYALAIKIKDELEKKGKEFGEPSFDFYDSDGAFGSFTIYQRIGIYFSDYRGKLNDPYNNPKYQLRHDRNIGMRIYGIENDNIGIVVYSYEVTQDVPESIRIAAAVIADSGYGQSREIQLEIR